MKRYGVRPSVCLPKHGPAEQQTRFCRFAGTTYRLIAARSALSSSAGRMRAVPRRDVSVRRKLKHRDASCQALVSCVCRIVRKLLTMTAAQMRSE